MHHYKIIQVSASCRYALLDIAGLVGDTKRETEANGIQLLLSMLLPGQEYELAYHDTGKPYLKGRKERISISHSHDKVALMIDEQKETGIDIELIRDKVLNVAHKYLSDEERNTIEAGDVEKHLVYWAAKETLYKIYGRKKVDFKEHLAVDDFHYNASVGGLLKAEIRLPDFKNSYTLHYEKTDGYILVYQL